MTNEQLFEDLKQLIEVTVRREVVDSEDRMNTRLDRDRQLLREQLDLIQQAIGETLIDEVKAVDTRKQLAELEHRVHRLEQRAA